MAEQGVVTAVEKRAEGSALAVAASAGDVSLVVEYAGDFDDAGGTLLINNQTIDYTGVTDGEAPEDPDTIALAVALAEDAAVGDPVQVVAGGQPSYEYVAHVSVDEQGDAAEVVIPFADRAFWVVGPYDPGVPVVVSDDLTAILNVPGRVPSPDTTGGTLTDPTLVFSEHTFTGVAAVAAGVFGGAYDMGTMLHLEGRLFATASFLVTAGDTLVDTIASYQRPVSDWVPILGYLDGTTEVIELVVTSGGTILSMTDFSITTGQTLWFSGTYACVGSAS